MKILSISTSSKICSVTVLEDTNVLKEFSQNNGLTHSESLMPLIQSTISSLNVTLKDIDLIVCDKGPGSFTGIRIGIATAKAFSDSLNIPTIGISSLEALAYNVKQTGIVCSLVDAKHDNVYVGVFEKTENQIILRREFSTENIYDILNEFKDSKYNITFVGDGAINYKSIISSEIPNKSIFIDNNDLSTSNLGIAGYSHFKDGVFSDIMPLYLRKSQAERMLKEKNNE